MVPPRQKRRLSDAFAHNDDDDDAYHSGSADSGEDCLVLPRPRKRANKPSASSTSASGKSVELSSIRIPICYHSEKNNIFTAGWWREITQRDSFWDDFSAKVIPGTVRKRFTVSLKTGPQKGVQSSPGNQQRRVRAKGLGSPLVSTTGATTTLPSIRDEVSATAACKDCSFPLSAEKEFIRETTQRTSKNMVVEVPLKEPQRRVDSPEPPRDPAETTQSSPETPAATPEAAATRPAAKLRSLKLKVASRENGDQSRINGESDSKPSQHEDEADIQKNVEPTTAEPQLKSSAKGTNDQARTEDEPKSAKVEHQDEQDAKVNPELPVDIKTNLNLSTTANRKQSRIKDEPDAVQIKHEDDAGTQVKPEPRDNAETKLRGIKVESDAEPPKPVINRYVRVKHGGAEHIVPSDELKPCTHNGEDVFIVNIEGTLAIVPAADVETLQVGEEGDLVKVKRELKGSRKGIKRERRRTTIEIEDD